MPSRARESIHNSNCGFRHYNRNKKMFSKNENRNNIRSKDKKKPKRRNLAPIVGLLPYSIKKVAECYQYNPRFVCIIQLNCWD